MDLGKPVSTKAGAALAESVLVEEDGPFQMLGQRSPVNRALHVWQHCPDGFWKCLLCGAMAKVPTLNSAADRYEKLTDPERSKVCEAQVSGVPTKRKG